MEHCDFRPIPVEIRTDELLLERLTGLAKLLDPVPEGVTAAASAAFTRFRDPRSEGQYTSI